MSDSLLRLLILSGCAQAGAKAGQKVKAPKGRSKILILVVLSGPTKIYRSLTLHAISPTGAWKLQNLLLLLLNPEALKS